MKLVWQSALAALCLAQAATAGQFLSERSGDWYRYRNGRTNQEQTSRMTVDGGPNNWRQWSSFGGLGDRWIYTYPDNEFFWMWNPSVGAVLLPGLEQPVGTARNCNLGGLNNGRVTVGQRQGQLVTPAGTFNDVTRLDFQPSAADAGVTSIWFARGVGIVKWSESSIAGPVETVLIAASVNGRTFPAAVQPNPGTNPGTTPGQPTGTRAPAEHAPVEGVLWGCNDTYLVVDTYEGAWRATNGRGILNECCVDSNQTAAQVRFEMQSLNVPLDDVEFLVVAVDTVWMRDYGPIIVKNYQTGVRTVADLKYYPGRWDDDAIPAAYATYRGWGRTNVNLYYEGGNFATDGRGWGFASRGALWHNNNMSQSQVLAEFRKLGCDNVEFFEPLVDEGTTHIDMFVRVVDDRTAVVSRYPSNHRQAAVTNAAAQKMAARGYNVLRVDADYNHDEYATYANAICVNGITIVPQYADAAKNRAALEVYRAAGQQAVGVDNRLIIQYGGAIHCISMQVPR